MAPSSKAAKAAEKSAQQAYLQANMPQLFMKKKKEPSSGHWTDNEKQLFIDGLKQHGRNATKVAPCLIKKTVSQVKHHSQWHFPVNGYKSENKSSNNNENNDPNLRVNLAHGTMRRQCYERDCTGPTYLDGLCSIHSMFCSAIDCRNKVHTNGKCKEQKQCTHDGCENYAHSKGKCAAHGPWCEHDGCEKNQHSKGKCAKHGPRCEHDGCENDQCLKGKCVCAHGEAWSAV